MAASRRASDVDVLSTLGWGSQDARGNMHDLCGNNLTVCITTRRCIYNIDVVPQPCNVLQNAISSGCHMPLAPEAIAGWPQSHDSGV